MTSRLSSPAAVTVPPDTWTHPFLALLIRVGAVINVVAVASGRSAARRRPTLAA